MLWEYREVSFALSSEYVAENVLAGVCVCVYVATL